MTPGELNSFSQTSKQVCLSIITIRLNPAVIIPQYSSVAFFKRFSSCPLFNITLTQSSTDDVVRPQCGQVIYCLESFSTPLQWGHIAITTRPFSFGAIQLLYFFPPLSLDLLAIHIQKIIQAMKPIIPHIPAASKAEPKRKLTAENPPTIAR